MNVKLLADELKKNKKIGSWKICRINSRKYNDYTTKNYETESIIEAERETAEVTIYRKLGKMLGDFTFEIVDFSMENIKKQIENAIALCEFSKKEYYEIPKKASKIPNVALADKKIEDAFRNNNIGKEIQRLKEEIFEEFRKYNGIKLNGMEIFVNLTSSNIINSNSLNVSEEQTDVYIEFVITACNNDNEQEFFPWIKTRKLENINVKKIVGEYVQLARDVLNSRKPEQFTGRVILSKDALVEFFMPLLSLNPIATHTSARLKYMGLSTYNKNKTIISKFLGDKITLINNPLIDYNISSSLFDDDGIAAKKTTLIDKGIFKNYISTKRYADYLKIEPSGSIGVMEILPGSKSLNELYNSGTIYEIVSFSSFSPNSISGDFSAEIRLGYIIKDGKKMPFKGRMFTGNVFELFSNAYFSKESQTLDRYKGPKAVRFENGVVS